MDKFVSIIILNYNKTEDTIDCLKSLVKQTYRNFEIIIIDNASEYQTYIDLKEELSQFESSLDIKLIHNKLNLYFAGGMNKGIKIAKGDYIGLLGHDTVTLPNYIYEMVKFLENNDDAGFICPKIKVYNNKNIIWFAGGRVNIKKACSAILRGSGESDPTDKKYPNISTSDYVPGSMCFFKKEIIDKIGLLDEIFFMYYEETDWNFKAKERGYNNYYVPTSIVYHKVSKIFNRSTIIIRVYFFNRNKQIFAWKHAKFKELLFYYFNFIFRNLKEILILIFLRNNLKKNNRKMNFFLLYLHLISILHGLRIGVKRRTNRSCSKNIIKDYFFIRRMQERSVIRSSQK